MKKAAIISIGNELLAGQLADTNAAFLGSRLIQIGIPVIASYVVGDEVSSILRVLQLAGVDADVVLVTGGLGPTDDDVTRQAFAQFLEVELELREPLLKKIRDFFAAKKLPFPPVAEAQAYMPAGAAVLDNDLGIAPGIMAERQDRLFFVMPGVPVEMKAMFEQAVLPQLKALATEQAIVIQKLKCFGAGESTIAGMLGPVMQRNRNPLVNCTAQCGSITLHIVATDKNKAEAEQKAAEIEKSLRSKLGELVYGADDQTMAAVIGQWLAEHHKTLAVAESCTGGLVAKLLTDVPGASGYFTHGWVTYSNAAKVEQLGVAKKIIEDNGAVSEQVAEAMAHNARAKAGADYAVAITGIAGPTGGTTQKPVGLVYISVDTESGCETKRFIFSGDRCAVRLKAANTALNMLRLRLDN